MLVTMVPEGVVELVKKLACGPSSERPTEALLLRCLTNRNCAVRVQLKPTTYCASIVAGVFSSRAFKPFL